MKSTVDEILQAAGAEHEARAPADVVEFPVRSKFLDRTTAKPAGREVPTWLAWSLQIGPYVTVAMFAVMAAVIWSGWRQTAVLADIGRVTCSADGSYLWVEEDPGSSVPRMREELLAQCARAYRMF
jgi:hypothetical protein